MGSNLSNSGSAFDLALDPMDLSGERGTKASTDAQRAAADQSNNTLRYMYDTQREDLAPWRSAGTNALGQLQENKFLENFQGDPGFQFRMQQGANALNSSAAARGMANSGRTMKELTRYGQDYASNEYNNAYNRQYTRLSSLAGLGNSANQTQNSNTGNYGSQVSSNQIGVGNAIAAANVAQNNRQSSLVGQGVGIASMFSDERLKHEIVEINKDDLAEMKASLKAFSFKYKKEIFGKGEWIGVMAQDLEKSKLGRTLVVEDQNGIKKVDMKKVMSLFLATLAEA